MIHTAPSFSSLALDGQPPPDWGDVVLEAVPDHADVPTDPAWWADEVFATGSMPPVVVALMGVRQVIVPLLGVDPGTSDAFAVREVAGDEALLVHDDRHLDFRAGVGYDPRSRMLRVTTAVWLHGWRGRLYFAPVAVLHDPVTRSMMRRAIRRACGTAPSTRGSRSAPRGTMAG
jgi:hypothetical protein